MKIAILHSSLSGYLAACLREFRRQSGAELLVIARPNEANTPFAAATFCGLGEILDRTDLEDTCLEQQVRRFKPDAVLVSGWADKAYNRLCRRLKAAGVPIIAGCDTQWNGSLRQRVASLIAPWHVKKFIDVLWVAGTRQRQLAEALGFRGNKCWEGCYACDWEAFSGETEVLKTETLVGNGPWPVDIGPEATDGKNQWLKEERPRAFLFVGRYVPEKGIDVLVKSYRQYRTQVENPWALVCAGKGEMVSLLKTDGVEDRGFVQPMSLPQLMRQASCFVLPSRFEPWGVVAQEAAASGLPLIVSQACGSGDHLVRDGHNGFVTQTGDVNQLAAAMVKVHHLPDAERRKYAQNSFDLSRLYTPGRWARTLVNGLAEQCELKTK